MCFGDVLQELRKDKGLKQEELADLLGLKRSTISNHESSSNYPEVATLIKLADFYNVNIDYLLGRTRIRSSWTDVKNGIKLSDRTVSLDEILRLFDKIDPKTSETIIKMITAYANDYGKTE